MFKNDARALLKEHRCKKSEDERAGMELTRKIKLVKQENQGKKLQESESWIVYWKSQGCVKQVKEDFLQK